MQNLERLAVRVKILAPEDSLGKAAEAVRCSAVSAVPVVDQGFLLGLITSSILAEAVVDRSPEWLKEITVADLPLERAVALPESLEPSAALQFFQANCLERAPVVDAAGGFVGMVSHAELVSAVCGRIRPPIIGGMATPFGVYLTGGGVRGGVGDLALLSTGVYLALLNAAALWLTDLLFSSGGWISSLPAVGQWLDRLEIPVFYLTLPIFALFFRLSWITGYHAAEHQVVHTIEAGDDLRPDVVGAKPRVHPRCGTNLVAAVMIMTLCLENRFFHPFNPFLAMVATFVLWRRVGGWMQQHVTTRPASLEQLISGIVAGEQLMERYQQRPGPARNLFRRIWNMGLLQVLGGSLMVFGLLAALKILFPHHLPEVFRQLF